GRGWGRRRGGRRGRDGRRLRLDLDLDLRLGRGLRRGRRLAGRGLLGGFLLFLGLRERGVRTEGQRRGDDYEKQAQSLGHSRLRRLIPEVNQSLNDNPERRDNNTFSTAAARDRFF